MDNKDTANHVFARRPDVKAVYVTPDGQVFEQGHKADAHAQRFPKGKAEKFLREESVVGKAEAKAAEEAKAAKEAKAKAKAAEAEKIKTELAAKANADAKAAEEAKVAKDIDVKDAKEVKAAPKPKKSTPKKQ